MGVTLSLNGLNDFLITASDEILLIDFFKYDHVFF